MNSGRPYPVRTPLSQSMSSRGHSLRERIAGIREPVNRRPKAGPLCLLLLIALFSMQLVSCRAGAAEVPSVMEPGVSDPAPEETEEESVNERLLRRLLQDRYRTVFFPDQTVAWDGDEPAGLKEGDMVLGPVEVLGRAGQNVLFRLQMSEYREDGRIPWEDNWVVVSLSPEGQYRRVEGTMVPDAREESIEERISRICWNVSEPELTFFRDGNPDPLSPGKEIRQIPEQFPVRTAIEPLGSVYGDLDSWQQFRWDGLTATCYHVGQTGTDIPYILDTTRTDLVTLRGVRIGDRREAVRQAYPELQTISGPDAPVFQGMEDLSGADVLWYCVSGNEIYTNSLFFFFKDDTLTRMVLYRTPD